MNLTRILVAVFVVAGIGIFVYSLQGSESPEDFANEIQKEREAKNGFMKEGEDSPFKLLKESFSGLKYFPPDLKYRVNAKWEPIPNKKMILLPTSDGLQKKYLEHAYAEFELGGVINRLLVLEITELGPYRGTLFLAFADETSASETYGAGRYLDVKKAPGASSVILDFNRAYNPYCAYSDDSSCPFPPKENILKIAIRAGEKTYH